MSALTATATLLPDPRKCPLCGQPNVCALELARSTGQAQAPCWCRAVAICPATLAGIAPSARDLACICSACATKTPPA